MAPVIRLRVSLKMFPGVPENAILGANMFSRRRRSKNSGGRIAPAASWRLIEALFSSVNAFPASRRCNKGLLEGFQALARLNFVRPTGIGRPAIRQAENR
jgi:hypothetical protein